MKRLNSRIYLHYIWPTRKYEKILSPDAIEHLKRHIRENATRNQLMTLEVNGVADHFHLFVEIPPSKSAAEVINLIKGEASYWLNSNDFFPSKFSWENEYHVFSVSESLKEKMILYIRDQQILHRRMSFLEEMRKLYQRHGLVYQPKGL